MSVAATQAERKSLSGAPKVCGILSIIFASIVLLGGLLGTCGGFAASSMSELDIKVGDVKFDLDDSRLDPRVQAEIFNLVKNEISGAYLATGIISLVFTAMSAWLLAIGIGQVGYRRWARGQTVVWGIMGLGVLAGVTLYSMFVIGPMYQNILEQVSKHAGGIENMPIDVSFGNLGTFAGLSAAIVSIVIFAPYPIVLIALFRGERVRAAMTA